MDPTLTLIIEIGAALIFFSIMTILYKDNPLYGVAEHMIIGVGAAHATIMAISNMNRNVIRRIVGGELMFIVP